MNVELVDRYGAVKAGTLNYGGDEIDLGDERYESALTVAAALLLGYTIRKAVEA